MGRAGLVHYAAALALSGLSAASPASGRMVVLTSLTGGELASICDRDNGVLSADPCNMYIWGIADGLAAGGLICPKTGSWTAISARLVRNYIKQNPKRWSASAFDLVSVPLYENYPCRK